MSELVFDGVLLAQSDPVERLANAFRERQVRMDSGDVVVAVLLLLGLVVALWLLSRLPSRRTTRRASPSRPLVLLLSLCRAHKLAWSECWLLWRVARHHGLDDPARLFVEPERFDPANAGPVLRLRAEELEALGRRLFGNLPG